MARRKDGGAAAPAERKRSFDKEKQDIFFGELARGCNVHAACRAAGVSQPWVYHLRRTDAAFARSWAESKGDGWETLWFSTLQRGIHGRRRTVRYAGKKVGSEVEISDKLALELLSKHRPRDSDSTDRAAAEAEREAARARIDAKIDAIRRRMDEEHGDDW